MKPSLFLRITGHPWHTRDLEYLRQKRLEELRLRRAFLKAASTDDKQAEEEYKKFLEQSK